LRDNSLKPYNPRTHGFDERHEAGSLLIAPFGAGLWALPPSPVPQYGAQIAGALDKAHHNGATSGKMHSIRKADFCIEFPLSSEST
jgi:hypothetical protein